MVIRRRLGGAICLIPYIILLLCGLRFDNYILKMIAPICMIIGVVLSDKIYDIVFLNSNSPCALYAGNMALQYGYSPKGQNGVIWNPTTYKISEVYKLFPNERYSKPIEGTAGFLFYTNKKGTVSRKVDFYDYRMGGDSFIIFEFYFHPFDSKGDAIVRKEKKINELNDKMYFVSLEKL